MNYVILSQTQTQLSSSPDTLLRNESYCYSANLSYLGNECQKLFFPLLPAPFPGNSGLCKKARHKHVIKEVNKIIKRELELLFKENNMRNKEIPKKYEASRHL